MPWTGAHLSCHCSQGANVWVRAFNTFPICITNAQVKIKGVVELALEFVAVDMKLWNDKCKRQNNMQLDKQWKTFHALEEFHRPLACDVVWSDFWQLRAVVAENWRKNIVHVTVSVEKWMSLLFKEKTNGENVHTFPPSVDRLCHFSG